LTTSPIANLHANVDAFYADYLSKSVSPCQYLLLKVTDSHRWTRGPDGVEHDGTPLLEAKLAAFSGLNISTLKEIAGHFTIQLTENCDRNALNDFLESQEYVLGALLIPTEHSTFAPNFLTLYVLTNRVDHCTKDCQALTSAHLLNFTSYGVSTTKELRAVQITFDKVVSLPDIYFKVKKLAEDSRCGIVSIKLENLGTVCRKRLWDGIIRDYKQKHAIGAEKP